MAAPNTPPVPAPKPGTPEPAPQKGGAAGKLIGFVLLVAVVGLGGSMWWHGKKLGEAKGSGTVMPWEWNTADWESWYGKVQEKVEGAGKAASAKAQAAKAKFDEWQKQRAQAKAAQPAGTQPATPATPATPADPSKPAAADAPAALPEGFTDVVKLIDEASDLMWTKHDNAAAKVKFTEARTKLEPMAAKQPVHPEVTKAMAVCKDSLEAIDQQ